MQCHSQFSSTAHATAYMVTAAPPSTWKGLGSTPGQSMWDLWWKSSTGVGLSPSTSLFPCQYHSTNAACFYITLAMDSTFT